MRGKKARIEHPQGSGADWCRYFTDNYMPDGCGYGKGKDRSSDQPKIGTGGIREHDLWLDDRPIFISLPSLCLSVSRIGRFPLAASLEKGFFVPAYPKDQQHRFFLTCTLTKH